MIKLGSIIFYKNIPEFLSWLQRVWTYTIYSHTSVSMGVISIIDRQAEFDADIKVRIHSFDERSEHMDVLDLIGVPRKIRTKALRSIVKRFDGKNYGFIQWFTIALRFTFQRMGFKDTHKWNILWGWGTTCSELVYLYLRVICLEMMKGENEWLSLMIELHKYNPNTFVPQDIADLAERYPDCLGWV